MSLNALKTGFIGIILGICFFITAIPLYAEVGVTDTSVKVGCIADTTGPIAGMGIHFVHGVECLVKNINDTGGIHGRNIIFRHESDNYSPPQAMAITKKLAFSDKVFCFVATLGATQTMAQIPLFQKEKIPLIGPGGSELKFGFPPKRYIFAIHPSNQSYGQCMVDFMVHDLKSKNKKASMIFQQGFIGDANKEGVDKQMSKYGLKLVASAGYKRGAVDLSSHVLKCKNAGAEVLFIGGMSAQASLILKEAAKISWKPTVILHPGAADTRFIKLGGSAVEGAFVCQNAQDPQTSSLPGVIKYKNLLKKYYPKSPPTNWGISGYVAMAVLEKGLQDAGKNLTREGLVNALENLKEFKTDVLPPITYGPNNRLGANMSFFVKVIDGKFVKQTDYRHPR